MPALSPEQVEELERLELQALSQIDEAAKDPAYLLQHVKCVDSRSGEVFEFQLFDFDDDDATWLREIGIDPVAKRAEIGGWDADRKDADNWGWQRELLNWILENDQTICLKGRQLGVTWVACGLALWYLLFKPGTDVLIFSIGEDEAKEVVERIWGMYTSLVEDPTKAHLALGIHQTVKVVTPQRGKPSTVIKVEHTLPDGTTRISTIEAMTSSPEKGHSRSAALVIFDELARNPHARAIWKGVVPATADHGGKIVGISTANGMSDDKGDGNWYHYLWDKAGTMIFPQLQTIFLGWWLHPSRSDAWYENVSLEAEDKAEQYPNEPEEAFLLSGRPYFDPVAMKYYKSRIAEPLFTARFELDPTNPARAALLKCEGGPLEVYAQPVKGRKYAMGCDVATGTGTDYSVAAVIDLHTGEKAAQLYLHGGYDDFADQIHFLGLWYGTARIAIEKGGGYGDTVIAYLRDGLKGRKPYPRIYRHRRFDRSDKIEAQAFGFPMNQQTRPKVVSELRSWVNGQLWTSVTKQFMREARTFIHRDSKPTPRHADGANDDCIFAWGIALELFAIYGEHEHDRRKKTRAKARKKPKGYRKLPTQS